MKDKDLLKALITCLFSDETVYKYDHVMMYVPMELADEATLWAQANDYSLMVGDKFAYTCVCKEVTRILKEYKQNPPTVLKGETELETARILAVNHYNHLVKKSAEHSKLDSCKEHMTLSKFNRLITKFGKCKGQ